MPREGEGGGSVGEVDQPVEAGGRRRARRRKGAETARLARTYEDVRYARRDVSRINTSLSCRGPVSEKGAAVGVKLTRQ